MISATIHGQTRSKEFETALPCLFIKTYYKGKPLQHIQTAVSGDDGRFAIGITENAVFKLPHMWEDLSFHILDEFDGALIHQVDFFAIYPSFDILIPLEAFSKIRKPIIELLGDDGKRKDQFETGESLGIRASRLVPLSLYEIMLSVNDKEVAGVSVRTDSHGHIDHTIIWPQLGINDLESKHLLTPAEAALKWQKQPVLLVVKKEKDLIYQKQFVVHSNGKPYVLAAARNGRPVNAIEGHKEALYILPGNMGRKGTARILLVKRQHDWNVGDAFEVATGRNGKPVVKEIDLAKLEPASSVLIARAGQLVAGAYDIIVRPLRYGFEDNEATHVISRDVVSGRRITGVVVRENFWNAKPVLGGCVNKLPISGRSVSGAPYFQYADTFTVGENIYGALDPGIVDPSNISKACALYVIQSKDDATWNIDNSLTHLPLLGGNAAVQKVMMQPGCMNMNKHLLWANATVPGDYDVIADFGNNSPTIAGFVQDDQYNTPLDIIDGYFVPGFKVVEDPGTMMQWAHAGTWHYDEMIVNAMGINGSPVVTDENDDYFTPGGYIAVNRTIRLKAQVFYPADVAGVTNPAQISPVAPNYPLIVIVHGNGHNYTSYDFLLTHFARNGFIAVSIDCRYLSGMSLIHGMSGLGRAEALFKHLEVINTKFGATVQNNIGIMGHSRGGEAVLKAARINQQSGLGHHFNAIMSLAPTDQYGSEVLSGAWSKPYFVLYGSRDGDINGDIWTAGYTLPQTGFALWDRAAGSEKTMAFVYLATHNGFVTANSDSGDAGLLTPAVQKTITAAYMNAWFRMQLKNEAQWKGMFTGEWKPGSVNATPAQLFTQYQATGTRVVDNFEGAVNWQVSTINGTVSAVGLPMNPDEGKLRILDAHSPHDSQGLKVRWNNTTDGLEFSIPAGQRDVSGFTHVSVRIAQKDGSAFNPANMDQNLRLALKDGANNERAVRVSSFFRIPYPEQRPSANLRKSAMVSVRIPLKSYTIVCAGQVQVDLTNVVQLSLKFSEQAQGEIDIDTIEFTN